MQIATNQKRLKNFQAKIPAEMNHNSLRLLVIQNICMRKMINLKQDLFGIFDLGLQEKNASLHNYKFNNLKCFIQNTDFYSVPHQGLATSATILHLNTKVVTPQSSQFYSGLWFLIKVP
jgi:hypothetical protein